MHMSINYSVIIRTIGKAGEKYQSLLNSIAALDPPPREVIVVLPEGYEEPAEKLGWETFSYSPKGMVSQRMYGIAKCKTPYALVCDDDVCFTPDFVKKLYAPLQKGCGKISIAPLYSFLPQKGIHAFIDAISGAASPTIFHRDRYVSVLRTTGYSYNRHLKEATMFYETQSAAWTCFFADVQAVRELDFEAEQTWLDANGYSAMDDQTMFYKAWLRGFKTIVVSDASYIHQDAKTSTRNNKPVFLKSVAFNRVVFWHRFIYSMEKTLPAKMWAQIAFTYRMTWIKLWIIIDYMRGRYSKADLSLIRQGRKEGWKYVKSAEYQALPAVGKE